MVRKQAGRFYADVTYNVPFYRMTYDIKSTSRTPKGQYEKMVAGKYLKKQIIKQLKKLGTKQKTGKSALFYDEEKLIKSFKGFTR